MYCLPTGHDRKKIRNFPITDCRLLSNCAPDFDEGTINLPIPDPEKLCELHVQAKKSISRPSSATTLSRNSLMN